MKILTLNASFFIHISVYLCAVKSDEITDADYYKLPDLFALQHYDKCLSQKDGVFCMGTFDLEASNSSAVYDKLVTLTKNTLSNFNHTKIHRGLCLGGLGKCGIDVSKSIETSFERCVDEHMQRKYGLRAKLHHLDYCKSRENSRKIDVIDRMFIIYAICVISLNIIGTLYNMISKDTRSKDKSWLTAFSLQANWRKLVDTDETKNSQFSCFHGLRAILCILVHIAHAPIGVTASYVPNPRITELVGSRPELVMFFNGTSVIQIFIVMTTFLRSLKTMNELKKSAGSFNIILNAIIERIVRIRPSFITMVALSATLVPYISDGPLWTKHIEREADLCRKTFWRQLFLIQNFYPPSCLPQAWYLSVDFQVYVLTTIITMYIVRKKKNVLKWLISLLISSIVIVFVIVYALKLKPSLQMLTPENFLSCFEFEKSFHLLYQSLWGNFPSAIIGIILSYVYVNLKINNCDLRKNKWFVTAYKLSIPVGLCYILTGFFFLFTTSSRFYVSLFATLDKPVFASIMSVFILGCIFEVDAMFRHFIEWRGWIVLSRLSLSSLLIHGVVNIILVSNRLFPLNMSVINVLGDAFAVSVFTFLFSTPLCLMIEYPAIELYKKIIAARKPEIPIKEINSNKIKNN